MNLMCRITPELIKKGKKKFCSYCPAALAIKHAFADSLLNLTEVTVNEDNIKLKFTKPSFGNDDDEDFERVIRTPKRLKRFIPKFDKGQKPDPINFILKLDLNT